MATATDVLWNDPSYWSEPAEQAFSRARNKARREALFDRLRARRSTLASFDDVVARSGLLPESVETHRTVLLAQIVGSVGKSRFFTHSFLPTSDTLLQRWKRAFAVAQGIRGYEPVELYETNDGFYVVDGHFRISVARALGYDTIQARVRRWL